MSNCPFAGQQAAAVSATTPGRQTTHVPGRLALTRVPLPSTLSGDIRRQTFEGLIAAMVTASFGLLIWFMPADWQAAPWIVAGHLLATISSGVMLIRQDAQEAELMRSATSLASPKKPSP